MQDSPAPPGDSDDDPRRAEPPNAAPALIGVRAQATALPPLVTAPMAVERPPRSSGGPAAALVGVNDTLRKSGLWRGLRLLRALNQERGFVCSGCAWPTPDARARFELCESGVRAVADEANLRRVGPRLFQTYTIPELARRSDHWLASQGRLTTPMIRRSEANGYEPITWDEAFERVGSALAALPDPGRAVFYSSARVANEPAFVWQLLARAIGSNNLASSSQLCHEASRLALGEILGEARASVSLADFEHAEAIFVFGSNPGSNHPRMLASLRAARQRGAKVVAINPLREAGLLRHRDPRRPREWLGEGLEVTDLLLPVKVAGDLALLVGLGKAVLEVGAVDREFIAARTRGFAEYEAALGQWSWARIVADSGIEEAEIREAAEIYARSRATILCWGLGLTQHREGVATLEQLLALLLLRGNLGKPGAGPLALLGHSNTAGCWRMDADPTRLAAATGLELPREPGLDVLGSIAAMHRGEVEVFMSLGGNLLSAGPDTEHVADALRRCKLTVHLATKLNRAHLITGETALLLPCLGRSELDHGPAGPRWLSFEDMSGVVRASTGRLPPAGEELRSELEIITGIAAVAAPEALDWRALGSDYDRVRELIAAAVPGCEGFADELGRARSLTLRPDVSTLGARFAPPPTTTVERGEDEFLLTSVRSHDQHNSTIYGHGDRERGIGGYRRVVLMNLADIRRLELEPFEQVDLCSRFEGRERLAPKWVAVPHHIPPGNLAVYWPEANALIPTGHLDPRSRVPAYKSVLVTVRRAA